MTSKPPVRRRSRDHQAAGGDSRHFHLYRNACLKKERDNLPHAFRAGIQRGFYTEHVRSYNSGHLDPLRGGSPLTSLEHLAKI